MSEIQHLVVSDYYFCGLCKGTFHSREYCNCYPSYTKKSPMDVVSEYHEERNLTGKDKADPFKEQVGGGHYKSMKIQPIEFVLANDLGFCEGNIIKYTCRYKQKGGIEDLKKVIHYAQLLIAQLEKDK